MFKFTVKPWLQDPLYNSPAGRCPPDRDEVVETVRALWLFNDLLVVRLIEHVTIYWSGKMGEARVLFRFVLKKDEDPEQRRFEIDCRRVSERFTAGDLTQLIAKGYADGLISRAERLQFRSTRLAQEAKRLKAKLC